MPPSLPPTVTGDEDRDPPGPGTVRVFDVGSVEDELPRGLDGDGVMEGSEQRLLQRFLMILELGDG